MNILSILTCILCFMVVVNATDHNNAPIESPIKAPSPSPFSPSPTPSADCSTIIMDMMPCLQFLEADSNVTKPDASCCSGFKQVVNTDPSCICVALAESVSLGIAVNMTQAAALPSVCGVSSPPLSNCNSTTPPSPSPGTTPPSASPVLPPSPANPPAAPILPPTPMPVAPTPMPSAPTSKSPAMAPAVEAPVQAPTAQSDGSVTTSLIALVMAAFASFYILVAY